MSDKKKNKGCLVALLVVIGLMLVGIIVFSSFIGNISRGKQVKVTAGATLVLDFNGPLAYQEQGLWEESSAGIYPLLYALERSADDSRVTSILIRYSGVPAWQIEEINNILEEVKKSGKKIYAYYDNLDSGAFLASRLADEIWMQPSASSFIDLKGYYFSMPFYKRMFDKLGIEFTVIHMGAYKGTGENYTQREMSPEMRSNLESVVDGLFSRFVESFSRSRKLDKADFEKKILDGDFFLISPEEALEYKLVDKIGYETEFYKSTGIDREKCVPLSDYAGAETLPMAREKIALIYAQGTISMGESRNSYNPLFGRMQVLGEETFTELVRKAEERDDIKGIVVRVDSPGGDALASDIMWASLKRAAGKKPVFVSVGGMGASGGYYISTPAKKIFVDETSIVGSIGVVAMLPNFRGLAENKVGLDYQVISKGRYAGFGDPFKEVTGSEALRLKESMEKTYTEFKSRVAEGRGMSMERVEELAQGKIYLGGDFVHLGLADEIGGLRDAFEAMKEELKLKRAQIVIYPEPLSFWERLREGSLWGMNREPLDLETFLKGLTGPNPVKTEFICWDLDEAL